MIAKLLYIQVNSCEFYGLCWRYVEISTKSSWVKFGGLTKSTTWYSLRSWKNVFENHPVRFCWRIFQPWSRLLGSHWDEAPNHGIPIRLGRRSLIWICLKMRDPQLYGHFNRDMMINHSIGVIFLPSFSDKPIYCQYIQYSNSKPSLLLP